MLSLLAIASPKRIREISDRPNWKITAKGVGGQRFTHAAIFYCFCAVKLIQSHFGSRRVYRDNM